MRPFLVLPLAFLAMTTPAVAQEAIPPLAEDPFAQGFDLEPSGVETPTPPGLTADAATAPAAPPSREARLDTLFAQLKRERSPEAAQIVAAQIQAAWLDAESDTTTLLMQWSADAIAGQNRPAALDLLDQIVVLDPDYAEGWNRRATLNYEMSRFGRSIADIEQTLAREPRHFGALMGLGAILETFGREAQAMEIYLKALEVYPTLKGAQDAVTRLADEASGQPS